MKKLYLWAQVDGSSASDVAAALKAGFINEVQAHCPRLQAPHAEQPEMFWLVGLFCFADVGLLHVAAQPPGPEAR